MVEVTCKSHYPWQLCYSAVQKKLSAAPKCRRNTKFLRANAQVTEWSNNTFSDSISYVGGVAFGKDIGAEMTPLSTSSRLVSYIYSFLALIMINTYCANLMAFLLEENVGLPITGINDPKVSNIEHDLVSYVSVHFVCFKQ